MPGLTRLFATSAAVAAASAVLGIAVNFLRPGGLPLFSAKPYEIYVPCPEPVKEVEAAGPHVLFEKGLKTLVIDARPARDYEKDHAGGARSIPFDYLYPVAESTIISIVKSRAGRVAVYGDGARPDCGHELARELAGRGIRNVVYIPGGFPALEKTETHEPE